MENQTTNQTENKYEELDRLIVENAKANEAFAKKLISMGYAPSLIYILSLPVEGNPKGNNAFSMIVEGQEVGLFKAFLKAFKHGSNLHETAGGALVAHKLMGGQEK